MKEKKLGKGGENWREEGKDVVGLQVSWRISVHEDLSNSNLLRRG